MTVKIIKRGNLKGDREHQTQCHECQTIFSFAESDASYSSDQRDGNAMKIQCPVCQVLVWVRT